MNNDLISRSALISAIEKGEGISWERYGDNEVCVRKKYIDNTPTVEVPDNAVNCVLTMFGECSYNKTGCGNCEIKDKIRKALDNERPQVVLFAENITEEEKQKLIAEIKAVMDNTKFTEEPERPKGEWHHYTQTLNFNTFYITECPYCGLRVKEETNFCPNCGADMKGGAE